MVRAKCTPTPEDHRAAPPERVAEVLIDIEDALYPFCIAPWQVQRIAEMLLEGRIPHVKVEM